MYDNLNCILNEVLDKDDRKQTKALPKRYQNVTNTFTDCTLKPGMETTATLPILLNTEQTITVTCQTGYTLIGQGQVMCQDNNVLLSNDNTSPQCGESNCKALC